MTKYRLMKMSDHPMDAGRVRVQAIQVHEDRSMHLAWVSNPTTHRQFFGSRDAAIEFLTDRQPEAVIEEYDGAAWVDVNPFNAGGLDGFELLEDGMSGTFRDGNGNTVGAWSVEDDDEADESRSYIYRGIE